LPGRDAASARQRSFAFFPLRRMMEMSANQYTAIPARSWRGFQQPNGWSSSAFAFLAGQEKSRWIPARSMWE
jgi:hypothetical protein